MTEDKKIAEDLFTETLKWLKKADDIFPKLSGNKRFLENTYAYICDSRYFLEHGDLIRAFEAIVWAWAWIEIGLDNDMLEERD